MTALPLAVLALHIGLDLFDKHRHGIRIHDGVSILCYVVLAVHFTLDVVGGVR